MAARPQPPAPPSRARRRDRATGGASVQDWAAWRWRAYVLAWFAAAMIGLWSVQRYTFGFGGRTPEAGHEVALSVLVVVWILPLVSSGPGLIGMLLYRPKDTSTVRPIDTLVCWRIVSRGTNPDALLLTVLRIQREMAARPLFPYVIEVVADIPVDLPRTADVLHLWVPGTFATPAGSKYKARALHYAVENSDVPDDAWIVHLDEESHPTRSCIEGVAILVGEEEASGEHRIGQGCILYHRDWESHPFLTLADMMRTGDDMARFFFQYRLGRTIFGMHGSYIVVRNSVAKEVGFDFGPKGSITEDAFWALVQMANGRRARWCHGFVEEQSTHSVKDFVKQRRRWFVGLMLVARHAPVPLRWRLPVGTATTIWLLAPAGLTYTISQVAFGLDVNNLVHALANVTYSSFVILYFVGLRLNLDAHGIVGRWRRARWYVTTALLLPVFSVLEAGGVIYGALRPDVGGFHVVEK